MWELEPAAERGGDVASGEVDKARENHGTGGAVRRGDWLANAQFELQLGAVDDPAEAEADDVAEQVLRRIDSAAAQVRHSSPHWGGSDDGSTDSAPARVQRSSLRTGGTDVGGAHGADTDSAPARVQRSAPHPGDQHDQAADAQVAPVRLIRQQPRQTAGSALAPRIRRSSTTSGSTALDPELSRSVERTRGRGRPLPGRVREPMEQGFGADLSAVRVHEGNHVDALNSQLGARAFTVGNDVYFGGGVPDVGNSDGRRLIAHELAHTFQQGGVRRAPVVRLKRGKNDPWDVGIDEKIAKRKSKLLKHVHDLFGVKGMRQSGPLKRSPEAIAWRGAQKDEAREQGREDVDTALDDWQDDADQGNKRKLHETEKAYYGISAKKKIYSTAKKGVKTAVTDAADQVLDDIWPENSLRGSLRRAATTHLRDSPGDEAGAHAAAVAELERWYQRARTDAEAAKRIAFDKDNAPAQPTHGAALAAGHMDRDDLGDAARTEVTQTQLGEKAVKKTIEADSVDRGMGLFGRFLDAMVGSSGDQISLTVEFKVPIDPEGGGYVSFTLSGKAARGIDGAMTAGVPIFGDPRRLELMGEFVFRLGYAIKDVFDVGGDLKIFGRAGADSTALCMKALSYGVYRRLTGMKADGMANWWAGRAKGVEGTARERAEAWAAMVEYQAFEEGGGYSDVGAGLGGSVQAGTEMIGGAKISGGIAGFHRYDETSMKQSAKAHSDYKYAEVVADDADAKNRRKYASGRGGAAFALGLEAFFNAAGQRVNLSGSFSGAIPTNKERMKNWGVELMTKFTYDGARGDVASTVFDKFAVGFAGGAAQAMKTIGKYVKTFTNDDDYDIGVFPDFAADGTSLFNTAMSDAVGKGLASVTRPDGTGGTTSMLGMKEVLEFALIFGENDGQFIGRLEVRRGQSLDISPPDAGSAGVKITGEKKSRLLALGFDSGGKWDLEIVGVRARGKTNVHGEKHRM